MAYAIESEYNMKRTLVLFTIILSMVFCSACGNSKKENDMVKYESGNYHDKNWSETIGTYGGMVIPDEETALKIAKMQRNMCHNPSFTITKMKYG